MIKIIGPGLLMLIAGLLLLIFDEQSPYMGRLVFFGWIATSIGIGFLIARRCSQVTGTRVALTILFGAIVGATPILLVFMFGFRP